MIFKMVDRETMTAPVFYKCKKCKRVERVAHPVGTVDVHETLMGQRRTSKRWKYAHPIAGGSVRYTGNPATTACKCGAFVSGVPVNGRKTETACGAKCLAAKGPACECACGGQNHGSNHDG